MNGAGVGVPPSTAGRPGLALRVIVLAIAHPFECDKQLVGRRSANRLCLFQRTVFEPGGARSVARPGGGLGSM